MKYILKEVKKKQPSYLTRNVGILAGLAFNCTDISQGAFLAEITPLTPYFQFLLNIYIFVIVRFVDGASYFDAVANAIDGAKEEIFIAGWW